MFILVHIVSGSIIAIVRDELEAIDIMQSLPCPTFGERGQAAFRLIAI